MGRSSDETPLRRAGGEACALGGAGYAVLLQIAHPSVARGVHDHSSFASRPFARLLGTLYFVYGTIYGTEEEKRRLHAIVRAMHQKVTGPGYRALDHDLLLWVAATLFHSSSRLNAMVFGELGAEEYAAFLREASAFATALGLPEEEWPATPAEFDAYWEAGMRALRVGEEARSITRELFHPASAPLRPLMRAQLLLAGGLLPPDLREQFRIPWSDARQRRFDRVVRVARAVYPRVPRPVRFLPVTLSLWSMRRSGGWLGPRRARRLRRIVS
ncbi:oxygenase MpaB family protein [Streptomonospora nanhaiensis]|uniref:Oxygenase MpaB family protein n=1 Tax=Streptomonospora nanhaiensis TaxID=1323731 RepID=A0ABY6YN49_9ACTN|nr:oxygenase MpaB family protein [Streptomonospora nanhaiensis]WAE73665.1 oxygenase MpaB family protein [Streptomonospora nanhaiensis]